MFCSKTSEWSKIQKDQQGVLFPDALNISKEIAYNFLPFYLNVWHQTDSMSKRSWLKIHFIPCIFAYIALHFSFFFASSGVFKHWLILYTLHPFLMLSLSSCFSLSFPPIKIQLLCGTQCGNTTADHNRNFILARICEALISCGR